MDRLKDDNRSLKFSLQNELESAETFEKQHRDYLTIQNIAQREFKAQKIFFREILNLENSTQHQNNKVLDTKKTAYNKLEYEVSQIKDDNIKTEKQLNLCKLDIKRVNSQIAEVNQKNKKISVEYSSILKDYIKINSCLFKIYDKLDVECIETVIKHFKQERIQYQGYYSQVTFNIYLVYQS